MKTVFKPANLVASAVFFTSAAMAQVSSISNDNLVQYGKEDAYWVANVTCANESELVIQRKTDGVQWCGRAVDNFCSETKEDTANLVCGNEYLSAVTQIEARKQAQIDASQAQERARRAERERAEQRRLADESIRQQRIEREQRAAASAPLEKQISIEEQLIKIEQEKLDLRRQELELQRRAVEIEALLDQAS